MKFVVEVTQDESSRSEDDIIADIEKLPGVKSVRAGEELEEDKIALETALRDLAADIYQFENNDVPLREGIWSPLRELRHRVETVLDEDIASKFTLGRTVGA